MTHLAVQLPAGRGADRFGSQRVALIAIAAAVVGNALLLLDAGFELALLGRAVVGIGSAPRSSPASTLCGPEAVARRSRASTVGQR